jgi:AcrR family transcriptional regulator
MFMPQRNASASSPCRLAFDLAVAPMPARRKPRKTPAQQRSKETVAVLLTAAARILVEDGYERASVNRIAALAGVSVGSLYQYFPTKEALVAAVAQKLADEMLAVFQEGLAEAALRPFDECISLVARQTVRAFRVNPRLRQVIVAELPESLLETSDFDEGFTLGLVAFLEHHRERVRPRDLGLAAAILKTAVESVAKMAALRGEPEEVVADELTHLIVGYLGASDAGGAVAHGHAGAAAPGRTTNP